MPNMTRAQRRKVRAGMACPSCGGNYEVGERSGDPCGLCFDVAPWRDYLSLFDSYLMGDPGALDCLRGGPDGGRSDNAFDGRYYWPWMARQAIAAQGDSLMDRAA